MKALTQQELEAMLAQHPQWRLVEGKLARDYSFDSFAAALVFVNRLAILAEAQNHHPDIDIRYNKVRIGLITHDANGITKRDSRLASLIDAQLS